MLVAEGHTKFVGEHQGYEVKDEDFNVAIVPALTCIDAYPFLAPTACQAGFRPPWNPNHFSCAAITVNVEIISIL